MYIYIENIQYLSKCLFDRIIPQIKLKFLRKPNKRALIVSQKDFFAFLAKLL